MTYLLDTDTFILLLRGTSLTHARSARQKSVKRSAAKILTHCREHSEEGHPIGLSAISLAELEFGIRHGAAGDRNRTALRQTLTPFAAYPFDPVDCVHHYGIIRSSLESKGRGIGPLDTLIAAHAIALGATLVTHNLREFKRVPKLAIEDWA